MATPWIGRKKLALIPVYRPHATPPDQIPADWEDQIARRVLYDPDPATGVDRSMRAYINRVSSGVADVDAVITPRVTIDKQDVPVDALESALGASLRESGFHAGALVMLGGEGAGTAQPGGFWARFVMKERTGIWVMEFTHCLTGFRDLYALGGYVDNPQSPLGNFDEMSAAQLTHPTVYTKNAVGWLPSSAIATHTVPKATYRLHLNSLIQPAPTMSVSGIRIGSTVPYLMVEARGKTDPFDSGLPSEGVIVYRVQTSDPFAIAQNNRIPVYLLTRTALRPGQSYRPSRFMEITVSSAFLGGYNVSIHNLLDGVLTPLDPGLAAIAEAAPIH